MAQKGNKIGSNRRAADLHTWLHSVKKASNQKKTNIYKPQKQEKNEIL